MMARIGTLLLVVGSTSAGRAADTAAAGKDVFEFTKVHQFHLELSAKEWETLQQVAGGFGRPGGFGGPGGPGGGFPPRQPEKNAGPAVERHKGGSFGMEFPWAHASFGAGDTIVKNVGLRYKGNSSYMPTAGRLKRNFKVELDHYEGSQRFHGLKSLNLNAGGMDPSRLREALACAVYRDAGVPAPRTAFAEVALTVPGKYDKELVGLYTVVEQVDRSFLKAHFKNATGVLMKPERVGALQYLGEDWSAYKDRYLPKHEPTRDEARRVIDFVRLVNRGSDEQFRQEIASYLDVDAFLRFLAVTSMVANLDSFFNLGHNYYLYLDPTSNKFAFIPWDFDLSFAGFPMTPPEQQVEMSLTHPYAGENKLAERLLAMKDGGDRYRKIVKELATTVFTKEKLLEKLEAVETSTKEALAREARATAARKEGNGGFPGVGGPGGPGGPFGRSIDLRTFIEKRTASVVAQVDGKSKGFVPAGFGFGGPGGGFGGPGGMGMRPMPGEVLPAPLQNALRLNEGQRKKLADLQKEVDARLKEILDEEQNRQLKEIRDRVPGGFGPPGGGGPFQPPKGGRP